MVLAMAKMLGGMSHRTCRTYAAAYAAQPTALRKVRSLRQLPRHSVIPFVARAAGAGGLIR
jgi:hypothetical protein